MQRQTLVFLACAGLAAASAGAQSINIDFGTAAGVPAATYGGAGLAGHWNTLDSVTPTPHPLADLNGQPTGVTITSLHNFDLTTFTIDDPGTTGDNQALLDDFLQGFGDVVIGFQIDGLAPGDYDVVAYGWGPASSGSPFFEGACVWYGDFGSSTVNGGCMGGRWSGILVAGETHTITRVPASGGTILVQYGGSFFGASGEINGLQIAPAGSLPCRCDGDGNGVSDIFDLLAFLDGWFAGNGDYNGDGTTDIFDLLGWLDCFFVGCA